MIASSNLSASSKPNSKRKSSEPTSDAEDPPEAKRIRSTKDGSVTVHEIPDENNLDFQPEVEDDHISVHDSSGDESDATQHQSRSRSEQKKPAKKKQKQGTKQSDVVGEDGLLADINVQPIVQLEIPTDPSADMLHFSGRKFNKPGEDGGGDKSHRTCTICKDFVADVSTNRRHYAKFHKPEYHTWCKTNDFESKLEEDVKARQQEQKANELKKKLLRQLLYVESGQSQGSPTSEFAVSRNTTKNRVSDYSVRSSAQDYKDEGRGSTNAEIAKKQSIIKLKYKT
ncbi:hypothetical protein DFH07DRAFT_974235 [Mycena maculata]|uniref:Uncharacterized protein n=1 Tax=Mycena maculata TaxID=230809 RepID=A0AAD7HA76_9AGAR|nr:hypothetical protein DFH07DRAFT_974235 [Mycena maculata]